MNDQISPPDTLLLADELADYLQILKQHNLVFNIEFPPSANPTPRTPLWEVANTQINSHFDIHGLSFDTPPLSQQFHRLSWMVIQPGRLSSKTRRRKFITHPSITGNTFHETGLRRLGGLFSNPLPGLVMQPLIFLGEVFLVTFTLK